MGLSEIQMGHKILWVSLLPVTSGNFHYISAVFDCFWVRYIAGNRTYKNSGSQTLNLSFLFLQGMADSSEDDEPVPDLVAMETGKVPITIITGFLGKSFPDNSEVQDNAVLQS